MTTTTRPLTAKDEVWREWVTFTSLNELVADSARILPSRALRNGEVPEGYFIMVEIGGTEETTAALLLQKWADAIGSGVQVHRCRAIGGLCGTRWYNTAGDVAGIRIHVMTDRYEVAS